MRLFFKLGILTGCLLLWVRWIDAGASKSSSVNLEPFDLSYPAYFGSPYSIPVDNPLSKEKLELGRLLFCEPLHSANNAISCGNCHQQKKAFTDGRKYSEGVGGALSTRNAMSLSNLLWVRKLFWMEGPRGLKHKQFFL